MRVHDTVYGKTIEMFKVIGPKPVCRRHRRRYKIIIANRGHTYNVQINKHQ